MNARRASVICVALGFVAVMTASAWAGGRSLSLRQLPAPVRTALFQFANGGPILSIVPKTDRGRAAYEADAVVGGREMAITVTSTGKLVSKRTLRECKVTTREVPVGAQAALAKGGKGGKIKAIDRRTEDGRTVYRAHVARRGKELHVRATPTGTLISTMAAGDDPDGEADDDQNDEIDEDALTIDQVPEAVRVTIQNEAAGGQIEEIQRESNAGSVVYKADLRINGMEVEIQVAEDGSLLSRRIDNQNGEDEQNDDDEHEGDDGENGDQDHQD